MVRLYVGGLPSGVTVEELRARFTPFGEVAGCSVAPPKVYTGCDGVTETFHRDFAHVELLPKDEASLRMCISAYNGCKWKGGVLRCSLARQHYAERLRQERAGGDHAQAAAADHDQDVAEALPPLEPGCSLRLRPPKSGGVVEVQLGSGTKVASFPQAPSDVQQPATDWEPLQAPPRSGYLFEQLLQRIAADVPPELVAAVEARRERGRALAEAREKLKLEEAGTDAAYLYSDDEGSLQLGSDDDAETAAAAAAAAITACERRRAAPAAATQRQQAKTQAQEPAQRRLRVVDFLHDDGSADAAAGRASAGAADLRRFDSDSDVEWEQPAAAATIRQAHLLPQPRPAVRQAATLPKQQPVVLKPPGRPQLPAQPAGSSGSSGGSELDEWLAEVEGDAAEQPAAGPASSDGGSEEAAQPAVSSGSSGGSELEELLAEVEGGAADQAATDSGEEGQDEGMEQDGRSEDGAQSPAPAAPQQPLPQCHQKQQQRGVVDFLQDGEQPAGRQWWVKPPPAVDLRRFASSSEDEEDAQQPQPAKKQRRQERSIPQVDGAADSEHSSSDEDDASSSSSGSDADAASNGGAAASIGSDDASIGSDDASSDDASSEEESSSGESSEEEEAARPSGKQLEQQPGRGSSSSSSSSSDSEGEGEEEDAGAAQAAAAAAEQQQQAALAALFPEGAAFKRNEPLAQIEASWRVGHEAWSRDYRQKHRQAVRMLGRSAGGGGGKRQRKG